MGSRRVCLLSVVAFLLGMPALGSAHAQSVTPSPLPESDFAPLGVRSGGLVMFPSAETGVEATDNVFQVDQVQRSDMGYFVAPALRIESDWVRHSLRIDAASRHVFYFNNPSEDELDFDTRGELRIDVRRDTTLEFEAGYFLEQEGRGQIDVPGTAAEPPNEHTLDGSVTLTHQFGRFDASVEGSVEREIFEDVDLIGGGEQNNSDRDYTEYEGTLRIGYDISPKLQPFVRASYSVREHDEEIDDNGLRRDSEGFAVEAGVEFEISPLLIGEVAVGYVEREYDDVALSDIEDVTFEGSLLWRPSPITTVSFSARTDVEETGTGTLSGSIEREFEVFITHALRQNLMVGGSAQYIIEDFTGGSLREETLFLALGLTYQFNRAVALRLGYSYEHFDSSAGSSFEENRFHAGLLVQK